MMLRKTWQNILQRSARSARQESGRAVRGFTLVETLIALLIFVILAAFVASGLPVAFSTYRQVVGTSNAQLALSTTTSALRDELGMAVDAKTASNGSVFYQTSDGNWAMIDNGASDDVGLMKHVYLNKGGVFSPDTPGAEVEGSPFELVPSQTIVGAANGEDLRVQLANGGASISYAGGVFTVSDLQVLVGGGVTEKVDEYKVKMVLGDSGSTP